MHVRTLRMQAVTKGMESPVLLGQGARGRPHSIGKLRSCIAS